MFGVEEMIEAVERLRADLDALPERIARAVTTALREGAKRVERQKRSGKGNGGSGGNGGQTHRSAPAARNGAAAR